MNNVEQLPNGWQSDLKAPFDVRRISDGCILTVIGFQHDPLKVGVQVAYFEGGGWLMFKDLFNNFEPMPNLF